MSRSAAPCPGRDEGGYALIAAVASIAVFAAVALGILTATRISIATGSGEFARTRARLAADAGMQLAVHDLANGDETMLALLTGGERTLTFNGATLTIRLIDERGKVPINKIEEPTMTRLLTAVGLEGAQLEIARDSLIDWQDPDDERRSRGAEVDDYARDGIAPRNASLLTIGELGRVRGFTPQLIARLRPMVTVDPDAVPFDTRNAQPLAIEVMKDSGDDSVEAIDRERETEGQRTALTFIDRKTLVGRPVTVSVDADTAEHGHFHREMVVAISGRASRPFVVHSVE